MKFSAVENKSHVLDSLRVGFSYEKRKKLVWVSNSTVRGQDRKESVIVVGGFSAESLTSRRRGSGAFQAFRIGCCQRSCRVWRHVLKGKRVLLYVLVWFRSDFVLEARLD